MVRKNTLKTLILSSFVLSFIAASVVTNGTYADSGTNFQVKVPEVLTVSVTSPNNMVPGDTGVLLRNIVNLNIISNNPAGITASMTSGSTTTDGAALSNTRSNSKIPMLTSNWTRSDTTTAKFWGYSTDDSSETGTYSAIALKGATTPSVVVPSGTTGNVSKDIYFGAKADTSVDSGTYSGTVIISVVSGTITENNPVTPTDPAKPSDTNTNNPTYDNTNNRDRTVYTATTTPSNNSTATTSTIEVSSGDTRSSYSAPAGVTTTQINDEGVPLATGLAVTAAIAAITGVAFLAAARRHRNDDGEDY